MVVVQAIRSLCTKVPCKYAVLMNFLSSVLREKGELDYKIFIIDTIISTIEANSDAKASGLVHLCEFIGDCEHTSLAVHILHLLSKESPLSKTSSKNICVDYNRVVLENATVRTAAESALSQFSASCPDLLPNI